MLPSPLPPPLPLPRDEPAATVPGLALVAALAAACAATGPHTPALLPAGTHLPVTLCTRDQAVDVFAEGELFATVRFGDAEGPCVFPLHAKGELLVTRGFPIAPGPDDDRDHPHHRSLWFAHGDVDGVDFWHGEGRMEVEHAHAAPHSLGAASVELALVWRAGDGRELLRERRRYTFHAEVGLRWIDAEHVLESTEGVVVLGDTKEGTFAMRVAPTLDAEGAIATGHLFDAEGRAGADVWGRRAPWIAITGEVPSASGGAPRALTVALLEHPRNFRAPTWWHARPYGLLAANPFGRRAFERTQDGRDGSHALARGETLALRYRVLIGDGPLAPSEIAAEAARFASEDDGAPRSP